MKTLIGKGEAFPEERSSWFPIIPGDASPLQENM